ncbi:MAG TPA: hypothetical protein VJT32_01025 [bacterium]|nr:hypothetical protein [bacterium]
MPFWLTWFLAGLFVAGGAAAVHNSTTMNTADTNTTPYYTQNFQQGNQAK